MRTIDYIIIHCAATKPSMDIGAAEIRDWHVNGNGWSDIGYHWVIRRDGTIERGRDELDIGAHVRGYNVSSIGICLVGGIDEDGEPDCNYTFQQWLSLNSLTSSVKLRHTAAKVLGHRDFDSGKACPVFDVAEWWAIK